MDKHKVWLIAGISIFILFVAFLVLYNPLKEGFVGKGSFQSTNVGDSNPDLDNDGFKNNVDNCLTISNPDQTDSDNDGFGDVCDCAPTDDQIFPQAEENCDDTMDNNCNDLIDSDDPACTPSQFETEGVECNEVSSETIMDSNGYPVGDLTFDCLVNSDDLELIIKYLEDLEITELNTFLWNVYNNWGWNVFVTNSNGYKDKSLN